MRHTKTLPAYSFSHFCVDFCCFFMLFYGIRQSAGDLTEVSVAFLFYNTIAFGLQPVIGYTCDTFPRLPAGAAGCALVAAGILVLPLTWLSLVLCALGNACFHVGGGIDSLKRSEGKMYRSGVFVSTGSLGVALGTLYGGSAGASPLLPLLLLAVSAALILLSERNTAKAPNAVSRLQVSSGLGFGTILLLALAAIVIRSFVGSALPLPWKTGSEFLQFLPAIAAFAGKAAGGFLGDLFGARRAGTVALLISIPLLTLGSAVPWLSAAGIVLFNVAMPITLCIVASRLPRHPGLAFGLTTLALLCGSAPAFFFQLSPAAGLVSTAVLTVISAACIFFAANNKQGEKTDEKNEKTFPPHTV